MKNELLYKALLMAKASNEIENKHVKQEHIDLVKARLKNEITEDEFQQKVLDLITYSKPESWFSVRPVMELDTSLMM